jgi:SAM-dependent methyltransferase
MTTLEGCIMQETRDVFRTGKYHKSFKKKHLHLIRKLQLRLFYRTSSTLMNVLGWPDPLARNAPRILLCGTASPYTTVTFTRFVRKHNSVASIDVLDISPYAVSQSARFLETCQDIDPTRISFIEGDALHMPFAAEYFDWIETDFFIQFFSPEEKENLFKEWYRVLKPGGVVTTRDWLMQKQDFIEHLVDGTKNWLIRHILGPVAHSSSAKDVTEALVKLGFEVSVFPVRIPGIRLRIPLMNYILINKPAEQEHMLPVDA